ncbi:peptidase M76 family-domain-containing protein [Paraphysoderma sedebokerense]|nr:peptidase M76 family-domain-containing protein [Paraphysoderma sedebokerense]
MADIQSSDKASSQTQNSTTTSTTDLKSSEPLEGFEKWRKSLAFLTGLGLSEQERAQYEAEKDKKKAYEVWQQCERWKNELMQHSPIVKFMLQHLEKTGCKFEKKHLICTPCDASRSGGFSPDHGVILCENRFMNKAHMEDTIAHELIHAFDQCRSKIDWNNCYHHACTEIRAASLSGDCRWSREVRRGFLTFTKQHQACVKRRAILSVKENPSCSGPGVAENAVNKVFDSCFADTYPFDEIYR